MTARAGTALARVALARVAVARVAVARVAVARVARPRAARVGRLSAAVLATSAAVVLGACGSPTPSSPSGAMVRAALPKNFPVRAVPLPKDSTVLLSGSAVSHAGGTLFQVSMTVEGSPSAAAGSYVTSLRRAGFTVSESAGPITVHAVSRTWQVLARVTRAPAQGSGASRRSGPGSSRGTAADGVLSPAPGSTVVTVSVVSAAGSPSPD